MSKKEIPEEIQNRLNEFHVDIPDIPRKPSKIDRLARWIYAPAKDPLEVLSIKTFSLTKLAFYPFSIILALLCTPLFFI